MKFVYGYNTKDNERREGIISAASRDDAYAALKKQGIKPFRVELAPGLVNRLASLGKRWVAIVSLLVLVGGLVLYLTTMRSEIKSLNTELESLDPQVASFTSTARRQVIGDSAVIEKGIRTGWSDVFAGEGERFLASFAIPGVPAGLRATTEEEINLALSRKVDAMAGDSIEARQIKSMVEGMKIELREYLAAGGTVVGYGQRLVQRQEAELELYNRAKSELDAAQKSGMSEAEIESLWEKRNASLRQMGIKLLSLGE